MENSPPQMPDTAPAAAEEGTLPRRRTFLLKTMNQTASRHKNSPSTRL